MDIMNIPPALAEALLRAQARVTGVGKYARNEQQGYDYTSAEDLIAIGGQAMAAEGVGLVPVDTQVGPWEVQRQETKGGMKEYLVANVRRTFLLFERGGAAITIGFDAPAVQSAGRPADKAVLATMTESLGYAIRDTLTVARGQDKYDISGRADDEAPARATVERTERTDPGGGDAAVNRLLSSPDGARVRLMALAKAKGVYGTGDKQINEDNVRDWSAQKIAAAIARLESAE